MEIILWKIAAVLFCLLWIWELLPKLVYNTVHSIYHKAMVNYANFYMDQKSTSKKIPSKLTIFILKLYDRIGLHFHFKEYIGGRIQYNHILALTQFRDIYYEIRRKEMSEKIKSSEAEEVSQVIGDYVREPKMNIINRNMDIFRSKMKEKDIKYVLKVLNKKVSNPLYDYSDDGIATIIEGEQNGD